MTSIVHDLNSKDLSQNLKISSQGDLSQDLTSGDLSTVSHSYELSLGTDSINDRSIQDPSQDLKTRSRTNLSQDLTSDDLCLAPHSNKLSSPNELEDLIKRNLQIQDLELGENTVIEDHGGYISIGSSSHISQLRQLCEQIGYNCKEVKVELLHSTKELFVSYKGETIPIESIYEIFTYPFVSRLITMLFGSGYRKAKVFDIYTDVMKVVNGTHNNKGELKISYIVEMNEQAICDRTIQRYIADKDFVEFFRVYLSIAIQAVEIFNYQSTFNSKNCDEAQRRVLCKLKEIGIDDIILHDGTQVQVHNSVSKDTNVNASGHGRTAPRYDGHKYNNLPGQNSQIKLHLSYSVISRSIIAGTITEGTGAETRHIYGCHTEEYNSSKLLVCDRGLHGLLAITRLMHKGIPFLIRMDTNCAYKILEAYDKTGKTLNLVNKKLNDDDVYAEIQRKGVVEFIVKPKTSVERSALQPGDDVLFPDGVLDKDTKQPTLHAPPIRVVAVYRTESGIDPKDRILFFMTSLPKEDINAESVVVIYRMRWGVEIFFKIIKQTCFFNKCNANTINPVLTCIYASLLSFVQKSLIFNLAHPHCISTDSCDTFEHIINHISAAEEGITRRYYELEQALCCLNSRVHDTGTNDSCIPLALTTNRPFTNRYDSTDYEYFVLKDHVLDFLQDDSPHLFRSLFKGKPTELKEKLYDAVQGNSSALACFNSLDQELKSRGVACDVIGTLDHIRSKINELGISIEHALTKPKLDLLLSLQKTMQSNALSTKLSKLFSENIITVADVHQLMEECIKTVVKKCRSKDLPLKSYERLKSLHLQIFYVGKHIGVKCSTRRAYTCEPFPENERIEYLRA